MYGDDAGEYPSNAGNVRLPGCAADLAISEDGDTTYVLLTDGTVIPFGSNSNGQAGSSTAAQDPTLGTNTFPTSLPAVNIPNQEKVTKVAAGSTFACFLTETGSVYCAGGNSDGQLGLDSTTDEDTPAGPLDFGADPNDRVVDLQAGSNQCCALFASGALKCWCVMPARYTALLTVLLLTVIYVLLYAMLRRSCVCRGSGANGALGTGSTDNIGDSPSNSLANAPFSFTEGVLSIDLGSNGGCAVLVSGKVQCWCVSLGALAAHRNSSLSHYITC